MPKSEVKSPLPGTFYRRPSPDEPEYKKVGDVVKKGDVLGLIEVMKTYTEITADVDGTIASFAAENEDAVVPGQLLAEIET